LTSPGSTACLGMTALPRSSGSRAFTVHDFIPGSRRRHPDLDRRVTPRAEYRRTAPALLEFEGYRCAVRDLGDGGLRIEPAPAGRVWTVGQPIRGQLHLRSAGQMTIAGTIARIDRAGLAVIPAPGEPWPDPAVIDAERAALATTKRERRAAPRLPLSARLGDTTTPLRDVSATGLRYLLAPSDPAPPTGSMVEGGLRLDADTVIEVRGTVVRQVGREVALALDPPGLAPEVIDLVRRRFFPEGAAG
jgi:hypothetical protein